MKQDSFFIFISLILFISFSQIYAQNVSTSDTLETSYQPTDKPNKKVGLLWSAGPNISKYISEDGDWRIGYRLGLTFNVRIANKSAFTFPFSYTRIHATPKRVEGKSYANDGYLYKVFVNRDISVGFIELPILFSYNFFSTKKYKFSYLLGTGLVIAVKDYSKLVQPEDVTRTDEIIGTHNFPVDPVETRFTIPNSGLNVSTGIRINVSRFYFDILYVIYPYDIKEINKLNSFSFIFSVDAG